VGIKASYISLLSEVLAIINRTLEHLLKCFQSINSSAAFNVFSLDNFSFSFMFCVIIVFIME
jgi:hypothetical protein